MRYDPSILRALIAEHDASEREIARRAGVALRTVQNARADDGNPRAATLSRLAEALGIEVGQLFSAPARPDLVVQR